LHGGKLEDTIRELYKYKASTVARVARKMAEDKLIQRGESNGYVYYRKKYER